MFAIWLPMLAGDSRSAWDSNVLDDPRVIDFWDGDRIAGNLAPPTLAAVLFAREVGGDPEQPRRAGLRPFWLAVRQLPSRCSPRRARSSRLEATPWLERATSRGPEQPADVSA